MKKLISIFALFLTIPVFAASSAAEKITDLGLLNETAEPIVYEFFSLGCPACFATESFVKDWMTTKPAGVKFVKVHVAYGRPDWGAMAQAYYAAEKLGVKEKAVDKLFEFIHVKKNRVSNIVQLAPVFEELGIDKKTFLKTANSFAVKSKIRKADNLAGSMKSGGVPDFVVNGRYRINRTEFSNQEEIKKTLNTLPLQSKQ
jgi:protein dithiol oxidoreductase (disulfide-forming)